MELMRAIADVVIIGAGALSADRRHVWTAAAILPALADEYQRLSEALGQRDPPLNVIVSGSGKVDLRLPVFTSGKVPALIITTSAGAKRLCEQSGSASVDIRAIRGSKTAIPAGAILVRGVPGTPRQANSRRGRAAIAGRLLRGMMFILVADSIGRAFLQARRQPAQQGVITALAWPAPHAR